MARGVDGVCNAAMLAPPTLFCNGRRRRPDRPAGPLTPVALLAEAGRWTFVGPPEALGGLGSGVRRVDLDGAVVRPGWRDAHLHLRAYGGTLSRLRLPADATPTGMAAAIADAVAAAPDGAWIVGRGWPASLLASAQPDWPALTAAAGDRRVVLFAHDGHTAWVSDAVARALGPPALAAGPHDPPGVRRETDCFAAYEALPAPSDAEREAWLLAAQRALLAQGVTTVESFEGLADRPLLQRLRAEGRFLLRTTLHLADGEDDGRLRTGDVVDGLRIGHLKLFLDGALGSRTAWLRSPYDDTGDHGRCLIPAEALTERLRALPPGLSPAMHAIGDAAIAAALDAIERTGPWPVAPRIEHAELLPDDLIARAARLGVHCSVQPTHLFADIDPAEAAWGARCADVLPLARMQAAGVSLSFGSDAPIEPPAPLATLYAACTRCRPDGRPAGGWQPAERLERAGAAAAQQASPLAVGQPADLVGYDADPLDVDAPALLTLRPTRVVCGGRSVHPEMDPI